MRKAIVSAMWAIGFACASLHAHAIDSVSFEIGGGKDADLARVGVQWDWQSRWFESRDWYLTGYWDLALGYWRGDGPTGGNGDIADIGFTPVFRFRQANSNGSAVYVEGAIGFHLLSDTTVHSQKDLGSSFEFGDHLGVGLLFGDKQQYDLAYRFQHLSNAGIDSHNPGINFHQIRFSYHF